MKLIRIEHRPNADLVRLHLDDEAEPPVEVTVDLLLRSGLAAGDEIASARLAALRREADRIRARQAALSLLAHRPRSRSEIRSRLRRKGVEDPLIDEVVEWLEERRYIDDAEFAEAFVRDRLRLRPRGSMALVRELAKKGVASEVAEEAVRRVMAAEGIREPELAHRAAAAWARRNHSALRKARESRPARRRARQRLYGHLARRGFPGDAIRDALEAVLGD